jgi:inner membrane protein
MPTVFTHALVGGSLAWLAGPGVGTRRVVLAAAALAVVPDLDVVAFALDIPYGHPLGHRGLSHSFFFAGLAALATAGWMMRGSGDRRLAGRLVILFFLATASHGLLDALTDAGRGVGFWIPFDSTRSFFPWRPLQTSPIGASAFLRGRVASILETEFLWVWLPLLTAIAATAVARRRAHDGG